MAHAVRATVHDQQAEKMVTGQRGVLDPVADRDLIAETRESLRSPRANDIPWEELRKELLS